MDRFQEFFCFTAMQNTLLVRPYFGCVARVTRPQKRWFLSRHRKLMTVGFVLERIYSLAIESELSFRASSIEDVEFRWIASLDGVNSLNYWCSCTIISPSVEETLIWFPGISSNISSVIRCLSTHGVVARRGELNEPFSRMNFDVVDCAAMVDNEACWTTRPNTKNRQSNQANDDLFPDLQYPSKSNLANKCCRVPLFTETLLHSAGQPPPSMSRTETEELFEDIVFIWLQIHLRWRRACK